MRAEDILNLARKEIVTKATGQNNVKYNTAYYGRTINEAGYAWCAVFLWWLFREGGAPELYYGGNKTAYCPTLMTYYKGRGQAVTGDYQPGDLIFFDFNANGTPDHVGLCESFDGTSITTIDGNTSIASDVNGGTVMRRVRNKKYIVGAARPAYEGAAPEEGEEEMTQAQFNTMMDSYLAQLAAQAPSAWSAQARAWAEQNNILSGDAAGNKQYKKFCTREEVVQLLYNQAESG